MAATAIVIAISFEILFGNFMPSPSIKNIVKIEGYICARLLRRKREEKTIIGDRIILVAAILGLPLAALPFSDYARCVT